MTDAADDKVEKTPVEKSRDLITQLKEMGHYSKANIERLTEVWLLLDGELKQKALAGKIEDLLTQHNAFHDALESAIADYEDVCDKMEKKPA
jgi:hypothetical protein